MKPLSETSKKEFSRVKYVLTDMDDTLTYHGKLPAETYTSLEQLQSAGIKVIPVTAAPAGWCDLMVRMWPIDAVIGENGGFYSATRDSRIQSVFWLNASERADAQRRLTTLHQQLKNSVPSAKISDDQHFRLTTFAWERPSNPIDMQHMIKAVISSGAHVTVNSLWVLAWFGEFDKLAMTRRMMRETYQFDIDSERHEVVYVGDSTNDGPMFEHFPNSVGVSTAVNFLSELSKEPMWVTKGPGGAGFVEVANSIISSLRI